MEEVSMRHRDKLLPRFICGLCNHIFRNATSISLCLHTFCRECIEKKLIDEQLNHCPICNKVYLGCSPLDKLRTDNNYENIQRDLFTSDGKLRKRLIRTALTPTTQPDKVTVDEKKDDKRPRLKTVTETPKIRFKNSSKPESSSQKILFKNVSADNAESRKTEAVVCEPLNWLVETTDTNKSPNRDGSLPVDHETTQTETIPVAQHITNNPSPSRVHDLVSDTDTVALSLSQENNDSELNLPLPNTHTSTSNMNPPPNIQKEEEEFRVIICSKVQEFIAESHTADDPLIQSQPNIDNQPEMGVDPWGNPAPVVFVENVGAVLEASSPKFINTNGAASTSEKGRDIPYEDTCDEDEELDEEEDEESEEDIDQSNASNTNISIGLMSKDQFEELKKTDPRKALDWLISNKEVHLSWLTSTPSMPSEEKESLLRQLQEMFFNVDLVQVLEHDPNVILVYEIKALLRKLNNSSFDKDLNRLNFEFELLLKHANDLKADKEKLQRLEFRESAKDKEWALVRSTLSEISILEAQSKSGDITNDDISASKTKISKWRQANSELEAKIKAEEDYQTLLRQEALASLNTEINFKVLTAIKHFEKHFEYTKLEIEKETARLTYNFQLNYVKSEVSQLKSNLTLYLNKAFG